MTSRRERIAWLLLVGIVALTALKPPDRVTPTERDLAFLNSLVEIKQRVDQAYVRPIDEKTLREGAIAGMLQVLDRHSFYVPPAQRQAFDEQIEGTFRGVGILVEDATSGEGLIVTRPLPDSPAQKAGVLAGDRIVGVDGERITDLERDLIIEKIKGPIGTPVTLQVERAIEDSQEPQILELTMERAHVFSPILDGYRLDASGNPIFRIDDVEGVELGYIQLTGFTRGSAQQLADKITELVDDGISGLILDLRGNPGGLMGEAVGMADLFLDEGPIVTIRGEHVPERTLHATSEGAFTDLPLVILVNDFSASASEVLAGALADYDRATIVGTRTFGKGSVQDVFELFDNGELKLTTAYYYLPGGRRVDRAASETAGSNDWGVIPDIVVPVDYRDPAALGDSRRAPFPAQVKVAVDTLLSLIAAKQDVPAVSRPATREAA